MSYRSPVMSPPFPTAAIATQLGITGNALYQIQPGVEIINPSGDLTLDEQLGSVLPAHQRRPAGRSHHARVGQSRFQWQPDRRLRSTNSGDTENVAGSPYTWDLMPVGSESWSYRLVAGAQFNGSGASTANFGEVQSLAALSLDNSSLFDAGAPVGSLVLGKTIPGELQYRHGDGHHRRDLRAR